MELFFKMVLPTVLHIVTNLCSVGLLQINAHVVLSHCFFISLMTGDFQDLFMYLLWR